MTITIARREFIATLGGVAAACRSPRAQQAAMPVIGFLGSATAEPQPIIGSSATDISARIFAQKLAKAWNVPVTVENVPSPASSP
jgi:hypothetical protein